MKTDTGWRLFLRTIIARSYPRVIGQQRQKVWIIFEILLPFISTAGYVFVYRAMQAPQDYIGFAVVGGAMTAFWINVIWAMSAQMYWEKDSGNLALYIMAPTSLMAVLLGMAFGGMFASALRATMILLLCTWLFHVPFAVSSYGSLIGIFALCMAALYGMGMLFASVFLLWGREAWQVSNMLQEPVYFLAGFYFPVRNFGFAMALVVSVIPLTLGLDAMRQITFATGPAVALLPVASEMLILAVLAVAFLAAAKFWLVRMERIAVNEGTLTDRRR